MFQLENVNYKYEKGKYVLQNVNYEFEKGKVYAIVGNSGAGKTTILSLLAGLDSPTEGAIKINDRDIKEAGYDKHRKDQISLIFQSYNLIQYMTALENVRLVNKHAKAELLLQLGLTEEEIHRSVTKLSGGQQQRVAIARALASSSEIILADEPTGNLDEVNAQEIMKLFIDLAHASNKCVIIVTHAKQIAEAADVVLKLHNKQLLER